MRALLDRFWHKTIVVGNKPYMVRYVLAGSHGDGDTRRSLRLHHILKSDTDRALHDHPWHFVSLMLWGSYTEHTPTRVKRFRAPAVIVHRAADLHRLELTAPVWTLVLCGRRRRDWGFVLPSGEWVGWRRFDELHPDRAS